MLGEFEGCKWICSTGYYAGQFTKDWVGIKVSGNLSYLRHGKFLRIGNGGAVKSYIFLDIPELMIACNQWPLDIGPGHSQSCLLYTSPSPRDVEESRMPSSA